MMFRDINQSSTMARSAYPDGNGELTDFNLFATKYDAGKPPTACPPSSPIRSGPPSAARWTSSESTFRRPPSC